ncbi:septum site-determining protein MinC [Aphanomyces invadans]|uniref:Septum site-determining protein MinC n=1 Tax=Aphanomyces invadans TaxID=157072 RepID=A0A024UG61_9STRA|nr:septum site-determining protein MinC [Aphanomyces invadans]ETW04857.1 septum site-determining protein MinC [Aphanomyces invadans]|eukprot:XP_008866296.1 septum site-determining protein MinC [Aphanomyces invadans]
MARKLQVVKPLVAASATARVQVLGGAYLIPTLRLVPPTRVNGEYDMEATVAAAKANWSLRGPVVVDLANVSSNGSPHMSPIRPAELKALFSSLKDANLVPIAITNASEDVKTIAWRTLQVPSIMGTRMGDEDTSSDRWQSVPAFDDTTSKDEAEYAAVTEESYAKDPLVEHETSNTEPLTTSPTHGTKGMMVVEGSVRTGQQIYAKGQGLVVMGSVNSGAEVLADGDIHVYGVLKGRALAGIGGYSHAKVYAQKFDAELISIADTFTTCDALAARDAGDVVDDLPTVVWLEDGVLRFKSVAPGRV